MLGSDSPSSRASTRSGSRCRCFAPQMNEDFGLCLFVASVTWHCPPPYPLIDRTDIIPHAPRKRKTTIPLSHGVSPYSNGPTCHTMIMTALRPRSRGETSAVIRVTPCKAVAPWMSPFLPQVRLSQVAKPHHELHVVRQCR